MKSKTENKRMLLNSATLAAKTSPAVAAATDIKPNRGPNEA